MERRIRLKTGTLGMSWAIVKNFQLSAVPPIGTLIRTEKTGYIQVESIYLDLDTDTWTVYVEEHNIAEVRGFYEEGGWEIIDDLDGEGKRELARGI